jgi:hypothetical protein
VNGEFIFVGVGAKTSWNISYFGKKYFVLMLHLCFFGKIQENFEFTPK